MFIKRAGILQGSSPFALYGQREAWIFQLGMCSPRNLAWLHELFEDRGFLQDADDAQRDGQDDQRVECAPYQVRAKLRQSSAGIDQQIEGHANHVVDVEDSKGVLRHGQNEPVGSLGLALVREPEHEQRQSVGKHEYRVVSVVNRVEQLPVHAGGEPSPGGQKCGRDDKGGHGQGDALVRSPLQQGTALVPEQSSQAEVNERVSVNAPEGIERGEVVEVEEASPIEQAAQRNGDDLIQQYHAECHNCADGREEQEGRTILVVSYFQNGEEDVDANEGAYES